MKFCRNKNDKKEQKDTFFFFKLCNFLIYFFLISLCFSILVTIFIIYSVFSAYSNISLEQIILHFDWRFSLCVYILLLPLLLLLTLFVKSLMSKKILSFLCLLSFILFFFLFGPSEQFKKTKFYETYYAPPAEQVYSVEKKKNIVFIHIESMDNTYLTPELSPFLLNLEQTQLSFDGYVPVYGTNWSVSSLVSAYSALPLKSWNLIVYPETFLKKAVSFFDILKQQGYSAYFMLCNEDFSHKGDFLKNQGVYLFSDDSYVPKEAPNFFCLDDKDTFNIAQKKISDLASLNKPFFFGIETVETHLPGFLSSDCPINYGDVRDSIACSDKRIFEFITWLQSQPFYSDTIIVLMGDHLMPTKLKSTEKKHIINVLVNSGLPVKKIGKPYTVMDMAPTVLEAAGINIQSHKFGLGVSLLSDVPTLVEKIGQKNLEAEIKKFSGFYNSLCGE